MRSSRKNFFILLFFPPLFSFSLIQFLVRETELKRLKTINRWQQRRDMHTEKQKDTTLDMPRRFSKLRGNVNHQIVVFTILMHSFTCRYFSLFSSLFPPLSSPSPLPLLLPPPLFGYAKADLIVVSYALYYLQVFLFPLSLPHFPRSSLLLAPSSIPALNFLYF